MATFDRLRHELPKRRVLPATTDPLARGDREAELQDWLEAQGVEAPWDIAPPIVNMDWGAADMEAMTAEFTLAEREVFARWLSTACTVYALLDEVNQGAERISEIVTAVKSYSHLDQAPVKLVDVHEGLENTLVILRHKLKHGVNVVREYDQSLPRIEAYAGELNQVWTNIIDNAVDAMEGKGELRLRTFGEAGCVVVEITDNGPGIPAEVQPRIYEAFFTTKDLGEGTGLGLHITYNIVVNQHHGEIKVQSRPGATTFTVKLPAQLDK
jgi:signal transduction histidine kinase